MGTSKNTREKIIYISKRVLAGLALGIGGILPGISGGILAVSFGLYRPILDAIASILQRPIKSIIFLMPIGIGCVLGFFSGSLLLHHVFGDNFLQIMFLFIGLILGGVPSFVKEANEEGFKKRWLITALIGLAIALSMMFLDAGTADNLDAGSFSLLDAVFAGVLSGMGTLLPGISVSLLLLYLGWYAPSLAAVAEFDLIPLIFMGVGAVVAVLVTAKLIRWIFSKFRGWAYYTLFGFLTGSLILTISDISVSSIHFTSILLVVSGFCASYVLGRLGKVE